MATNMIGYGGRKDIRDQWRMESVRTVPVIRQPSTQDFLCGGTAYVYGRSECHKSKLRGGAAFVNTAQTLDSPRMPL
jgi:hypothetical protein